MKRRSRYSLVLAAVVLCAGIGFAADAPSPEVSKVPDAAAVDGLVKQLGGDEFAQREQAKKALQGLSPAFLPQLRGAAEKAVDQETKARLAEIIGGIEEFQILNPPRISVEIKDGTLADLAAALGKATQSTLTTPPVPAVREKETITFKAVDEPFWDVMQRLAAERNIWLRGDPFVLDQMPEDRPRILVKDGAMVTAQAVTRVGTRQIQVPLLAALDPRVPALEVQVTIQEARDDLGNEYTAPAAASRRPTASVRPSTLNSVRLSTTKELGSSVSIRGAVKTTVQMEAKTTEIANFGKKMNEAVSLGDSKLTLRSIGKNAPAAPAPAAGGAAPAAGGGGIVIGGAGGGGGLIIGGGGTVVIGGNGGIVIGGAAPAAAGPEAGGAGGAGAANNAQRSAIVLDIVPNDSQVAAPTPPNVEFTATGMSLKGNIGGTAGTRTIIDNEGAGGAMTVGTAPTSAEVTRIIITDAKGKTVANYAVPRGLPVTSVHGISGNYEEPLKATITVPIKTREITIPFEFKDLPIRK